MQLRPVAALLLTVAAACSQDPEVGPPEGPVHDTSPPRLDVRVPLRGTIQTGTGTIVVSGIASDGDSGLASVTVNGRAASVAADGRFSVEVPTGEGLTLLRTEARDSEGNRQTDARGVLGGNLVPVSTAVREGVAVRLDAKTLAAGAQIGAARLEALDVFKLVAKKNPIFDLPGCLGARVELTLAKKGKVTLSVVPVDGGLEIAADVADVRVGMHVAWSLFCKDGEADITAAARHFRFLGTVRMTIGADGKFNVDAADATLAFEGFDLDTTLLPPKVTDFLEEPIGDVLASLLGDVVKDQVPDLILRGLGGSQRDLPAGAQQLHMTLVPRVLTMTSAGVELVVDSSLFLEGSPGAVYPASPSSRPALDPARGVGLAIADDAMNQMLASLWSAGVFERAVMAPEGGGGITALFEKVELYLRLPPVLSALPGGGGLRVVAADVECRFLGPAGRELGRLALGLDARVKVAIVDDKLKLTLESGEISMDLLRDGVGDPPQFTHVQLQQLGDFVADNLVGFIGGYLGDLPLPATSGVSVPAAALGSGTNAGYVVLEGDIMAR